MSEDSGIDRAINFGAQFDLVTPLLRAIHCVFFGGLWYGCYKSDATHYGIIDLLRPYHIRPRFFSISGQYMNWTLSRRHAWKAQAVFEESGLTYWGGRKFKRPPFLPKTQAQATPQVRRCAHCGGGIPAGASECPHCGASPFAGQSPAQAAKREFLSEYKRDYWRR